MKYYFKLFTILFLLLIGCRTNTPKNGDIISSILYDKESFYYTDFDAYPKEKSKLPIGIFDSGTGGLTVFKAIVNYDQNNNTDHKTGSDGILDFQKEQFIYLGDQANMPYGNYSKENNIDLLKEHIIKDAQFLMSNKYYSDPHGSSVNKDKQPVKVIVIACNTATAYGKESIEQFIIQTNTDIKVIGVIDAGVQATFEHIGKEEDAIIGVLATVGTVASEGYKNTILKYKKENNFTGIIEVFSQGGIGIAEAVDEDANYYNKGLKEPRKDYKGPSLDGSVKIDKTLLDIYGFDFSNYKMLCNNEIAEDCSIMQINDTENYVRYHLVTLMENIRRSKTINNLKVIILGCTHYPYLTEDINKVLKELYNYKTEGGTYLYRNFMAEKIRLVDPADNTAKELFAFLSEKQLFNKEGDMTNSEFYISVTNPDNKKNQISPNGQFTYEYKYGRVAGEIQEYTKIVPFSEKNISKDVYIRFEKQIPNVLELIKKFYRGKE